MGWTCQRTGQCCRSVAVVTMTVEEQAAVMAVAPSDVSPRWEPHEKAGFLNLVAGPCPFLGEERGKALCRVHEARPYNCRKFACFRTSPDEPLSSLVVSRLGETIPVRTISSRAYRREWERMVTKAERWARSHGWNG